MTVSNNVTSTAKSTVISAVGGGVGVGGNVLLVFNNMEATASIIHMPFTEVTGFTKSDSGVIISHKLNGLDGCFLNVAGVFVAIGQVPHNEMFTNLATLDNQGYFVVDEDMATRTPGLFVAGDCRAKSVRQVATAISDGAIAAVSACRYIDTIDNAS